MNRRRVSLPRHVNKGFEREAIRNPKIGNLLFLHCATIDQDLVFLRGFSENSLASLINRPRARHRARARMSQRNSETEGPAFFRTNSMRQRMLVPVVAMLVRPVVRFGPDQFLGARERIRTSCADRARART
jgi:hypothetical protein